MRVPITGSYSENCGGWLKIHKTWKNYYVKLRQLPESPDQPASFVVEAFPALKRHETRRVLDLGCGGGRHCVYLAKSGFGVIGVDVSESKLKMARKWIQKEKLTNVAFVRGTWNNLPFGNCHFDVVVSVDAIHHAVKAVITKTIDEIHRVLKKNGLFLANLISVKHNRYGEGQKVEDGTFKFSEHFKGKCFEWMHHFFTKQEASELLIHFTKAEVEPLAGGKKNQPPHYWKITAVK